MTNIQMLLIYAGALLAAASFSLAIIYLGVVRVASEAIAASRHAATVLTNPTLDENEKETLTRAASVALLVGCMSILVRAASALAIALVPLALMDAIGLVGFLEVLTWIATWPGIVLTTGAMTMAYLVTLTLRKQGPPRSQPR